MAKLTNSFYYFCHKYPPPPSTDIPYLKPIINEQTVKAEIITIGDEILIGQIQDTNSGWIAGRLAKEHITLKKITTVSDHKEEMTRAIDHALTNADVVIITGGLGPTKDDLTKMVLAQYFRSGWRWDQNALDIIEGFFSIRNRELKEINKKQAYLPDNCLTIPNHWGTAPGMHFIQESKQLFSLPGVPYEMKNMFDSYVIHEINKNKTGENILTHHFLTVQIPESILSEKLAFIEDVLPDHMKLAYLPHLNMVRLRLTCNVLQPDNDHILFNNTLNQIRTTLQHAIVHEKEDTIEAFIAQLLSEKKISLSVAESCTGGLIASRLTSIPGISSVFMGGVVSYSNSSKVDLLGVSSDTLRVDGAVSKSVVEQMADGCRRRFHTDYSLSVSGVAGPSGGTDEKPVGTVHIGLSGNNRTLSQKFFFPGDRSRIVERTFVSALDMLRREILNLPDIA